MTRQFYPIKGLSEKEVNLPKRSTKHSAGYDFEALEDVTVPSIWKAFAGRLTYNPNDVLMNQDEIAYKPAHILFEELEDRTGFKPTLIPTGVKANMMNDEYLELANRSSNPKKGLVLANGIGVIDKDYFENPDNDGHIFFSFFNFSEQDYVIKKHDKIGQGIFKKYLLTADDDASGDRSGGFGSTGN